MVSEALSITFRFLENLTYFDNVLCSNPTFTYQIDGPMVTYLGRGDHHETKYDHLEVTSMLNDLDSFSMTNRYDFLSYLLVESLEPSKLTHC